MDIFCGWEDYEATIAQNWQRKITSNDIVVIAGDISWGMNFEESAKDFEFINALPGQKLIIKGNHDYWWNSAKKTKEFWHKQNLSTLQLLHNNAFKIGNIAICGTRGWGAETTTNQDADKILNREAIRLETSISKGIEKQPREVIVFLHYPPLSTAKEQTPILDILRKYKGIVTHCFFGHLHGAAIPNAFTGFYEGIRFQLISADAINFDPLLITNLN
jgi:predicted phosphohydrolase